MAALFPPPLRRLRTKLLVGEQPAAPLIGGPRMVFPAVEKEPAMSEPKPLSFHVPAPAVRPGGTPDFSDVKISRAGEVERPPVDVAPEKIREHAFKIIRVISFNCIFFLPTLLPFRETDQAKSPFLIRGPQKKVPATGTFLSFFVSLINNTPL